MLGAVAGAAASAVGVAAVDNVDHDGIVQERARQFDDDGTVYVTTRED